MKTTDKTLLNGKILGFLIAGLVVAGAAFLPAVADLNHEGGMMTMIFLGFLGGIIAVQVVPGLMLFGVIVKGLAGLMHKEATPTTKKVE
jgi:hypothetical protein